MPRKWLALAGIAVLFISFSIAQTFTRFPFCDEAWLASSSRNLITKGYMGTSYIESVGTWARDIDHYTYWVMPLYPAVQTLWYKIVGFGLLQMRFASLMWGLVALAAWIGVVLRLRQSWSAAMFTGLLIACDYYFVSASSTGRMDMMSAALGILACAAYLYERERNLTRAIFISQSFAAAAVFTHPNAMGELFCLLLLTIYFDRRGLRVLHVFVAALPYLAIASAWGIYIAKNPAAWQSQLLGNISAGREHAGLLHSIPAEIVQRYLGSYGFKPQSSPAAHVAILILAAYAIGVVALVAWPRLRRERGTRVLFAMVAIMALALTFFEPKKSALYLIHVVPAYDAALAVFLAYCWSLGAARRWLAVAAGLVVLALQAGANLRLAHENSYASLYRPAVEFIQSHSDAHTTVMGNAELAFGLGFPDNLHDDYRLGFFTGINPHMIVVDSDYRSYFESFRVRNPALYAHISKQLSECKTEYQSAAFTICTVH